MFVGRSVSWAKCLPRCLNSAGRRLLPRSARWPSSCHKCQNLAASAFSTTASAHAEVLKSPYPDVSIPDDVALPHYIMRKFKEYGDHVALVNGVTGQETTYAELETQVYKAASALSRSGLKKGDVVTLFSPNCPEFTVIYLAVTSLGAVVSSVSPLYTPGELQHALSHVDSKLCFTVPALADVVKKAVSGAPSVQGVIVFGEAEGCRPFSNLLEDDGTAFPENVDISPKEDLAALPFSSGTTGLPKGVMLTHHNIIANVEQISQPTVMGYKPYEDSLAAVLPFFHIYGQVVTFLSGLFEGTKILTLPMFDPELYINVINKYKATFLHVVPPMLLFFAKHPLVDKCDFSSVHTVFTGAAPVGANVVQEASHRIKLKKIRQGYGLTEASPVTHCNPIENYRYDTIGPAIHNTEFKIIDIESGEALGPSQEGELVVKGPQVMKGYYKNDEATAATLQDGWLRTGDLGYYEDDGHVIISDRLKELIKYKGFQVAPAELEALLLLHPSIQDAAVIGKPDEVAGEFPRAYVVLKPGQSASEEEIQNYVADKVAPYKKLRGGVEFREEIPKSASGKIMRRFLKAELVGK